MRTLALTLALAGAGLSGAAFAHDPPAAAALPVEDVLQAPTVAAYSPAQFSPDGRLLAYLVTDNARKREAIPRDEIFRTGLAWYGLDSDIWIADLVTGERRNLTGGAGHHWAVSWSPDGSRLAFLADRSGGTELGPARLWVWNRAEDQLRQVTDADVREGFSSIPWTRDGRSVLVSLFPADIGRAGFAEKLEGPPPGAGAKPGVTVRVFENDPSEPGATPSTDQVSLDFWRRDLGLIDVETGKLRLLTRGLRIGHSVLSPENGKLVYSILDKSEATGSGQYLYDLIVQDLASGEETTVGEDVRLTLMANSFGVSPDGRTVAWRTGGPLASDEIYVAPAAGGASRRVASNPATDTLAFDVEPPAWDAASRNVFWVRDGALWRAPVDGSGATEFAKSSGRNLEIVAPRQQRLFSPDGRSAVVLTMNPSTKEAGFARVDLRTGTVAPIFEEHKRYGGYGTEPTISPDGKRVAYVAEDPLHPADIWVRGGDLTRAVQASSVAPALAGRSFGRAEVIEWRSIDGDVLHGALVYPADYEKGKRYPLIVKVYGGSSISNDLNRFGYASAPVENLQLYATRGYALLLADSKLNVGTPMVDLMKTVMPGINEAIEVGLADPDRIGVTGHSYGGYSTLALIAQSPRFKAAVMRAGTGNLVGGYGQLANDGSNYGLAWAEKGQGRMGGSPWEFRERYLENSPIFYLDRVETPLLIIHGSEDDAVPSWLADEVFTALRRLGKTVTYARYEGEDHWEGSWSYPNQIDSVQRILDWFDQHLAKE